MSSIPTPFRNLLVATDFSPHAQAALQQGVWLARRCPASLVLAHTRPNLKRVVHSASIKAKLDLLQGEGNLFQREVRQGSDAKLQRLIADLHAPDLAVKYETLLGEPFVEITHAVQQEGYDLVLTGTRGHSAWAEFFVGSTAKKLIRKCPASVWVVKAEHVGPPRVVLATTDFSDVSRKAVLQGLWVAEQAQADFHVLHVSESIDVPAELLEQLGDEETLRQEVHDENRQRLDEFVAGLPCEASRVHTHFCWGTAWSEIGRMARLLSVDLIAMGTVGRSGIQGLLLGNTAEKVLGTCDCSILTVKPDGFVSPIDPAFWPLH